MFNKMAGRQKNWLPPDWPRTVVPLEHIEGSPENLIVGFAGTGFLIEYAHYPCLVTCRHVVQDRQICYRVIINDQPHRIRVEYNMPELGVESRWVYHPTEEIDLALAFVKGNLQAQMLRVLRQGSIGSVSDVLEGDSIFFLGFPLGVGAEIDEPHHPIVRSGIIAQKKGSHRFMIEGYAYPGSSGSPIFLKPQQSEKPKLIGVLESYISYDGENSGLANCIDASYIIDILNTVEFQNIANPIINSLRIT